tara:strand:- start:148 stop:513 length:366 start_codon:yes stop_codon:yes gene_type:complete
MGVDTDIMIDKNDLGKNLYRKKTYYTLVVEQECLASNEVEASEKLVTCGIDHSKVNKEITETKDGVETYMVSADFNEMDSVEYMGKVVYADDEFAKENGDVEIDLDAKETFASPYTEGEGI